MTEYAPATLPRRSMGVDRRLLVVNAGLLGVLAFVTWSGAQPAGQPGTPPRPPGQYALISGRTQGSNSHTVYILDANNRELAALTWDTSRKQFEPLGYRNLAADSIYFRTPR